MDVQEKKIYLNIYESFKIQVDEKFFSSLQI
jgi:hypothetical protein